MNNAIASVAHRMARRLRVPNMPRLRTIMPRHRIKSARMERMAARQAPCAQPQAVPEAVDGHGLEQILRAARIEPATGSASAGTRESALGESLFPCFVNLLPQVLCRRAQLRRARRPRRITRAD